MKTVEETLAEFDLLADEIRLGRDLDDIYSGWRRLLNYVVTDPRCAEAIRKLGVVDLEGVLPPSSLVTLFEYRNFPRMDELGLRYKWLQHLCGFVDGLHPLADLLLDQKKSEAVSWFRETWTHLLLRDLRRRLEKEIDRGPFEPVGRWLVEFRWRHLKSSPRWILQKVVPSWVSGGIGRGT